MLLLLLLLLQLLLLLLLLVVVKTLSKLLHFASVRLRHRHHVRFGTRHALLHVLKTGLHLLCVVHNLLLHLQKLVRMLLLLQVNTRSTLFTAILQTNNTTITSSIVEWRCSHICPQHVGRGSNWHARRRRVAVIAAHFPVTVVKVGAPPTELQRSKQCERKKDKWRARDDDLMEER
jgi:hypothetical protein